jgi:hypothetical protein
MKGTFLFGLVALLVCIPTLSGHGQEPKKPDPKKVKELMRRKLEHAQKVLEGITLNDVKMIAKHADELVEINKQAEWKVLKTPQYEMFSDEFRRTAETLSKNAKDKNLDGASLTYLEMTLNCFNCHRYVRDVGWARSDQETRP